MTVTSGSGYAVHAFAVVVYCMYMHKDYVLNRSECTVLRDIKNMFEYRKSKTMQVVYTYGRYI